jgi:hypothetical protein
MSALTGFPQEFPSPADIADERIQEVPLKFDNSGFYCAIHAK